mmetsp:Transcript_47687/g.91073  ORF Transcript_47687/g.91073 Transcript_47687/m.91073 type:complete len:605 (+) Transcript_47687:76-1890(+)
MGFPVSNIVAGGSQVDEFVCAVCCQLAEDPLYTRCSHVFCRACLEAWLPQRSVCPKCNTSINNSEVGPLKTLCPLAWRLLGRLRCRCPLFGQSCSWEGDYSELGPHLTSNDTHMANAKGAAASASAETLNDQANVKFKQGAHRDAIKLYSKAISLTPRVARFYTNRAAAWLMVGAYQECVADCTRALDLDPTYIKGHVRLARALCEIGDFDKAAASLARASELQPESEELREECCQVEKSRLMLAEAQAACARGEYALSLQCLQEILNPRSPPVVVVCAGWAHLGTGDVDRAMRMGLGVLKQDASHLEAYRLCSKALYLKGDFDQATKHLRQVLNLNPDDSAAGQEFKRLRTVQAAAAAARHAFFQRDFDAAVLNFTQALDADPALQVQVHPETLVIQRTVHNPLSAALYAERAAARLRLKQFEDCLLDSRRAIAAQDDCKAAHQAYVAALQTLERFEECEAHLKKLLEYDPNDSVWQKRFQNCQFEIRKRKRPDYYSVLGVSSVASVLEIKNAYKMRALEWHPDRHDSEDLRARAEEKFKLIGEGLEILSDEMKRALYDEGYDKEAINERVQAAQRAAREDPNSRNRRGGGCSSGGCSGDGCH